MQASEPGESIAPVRRFIILGWVVCGATLYGTTLLTASTLLPQMQGAFSATQDEIAWTMTFNMLATAIVTPMTGWLTSRFGRNEVMVWGLFSFSIATLMCGLAQSLEALVFWRVAQGALGAPLVPLSQTIMFDTFPKRQQAMAMSVFGIGVVIGPVIGPTLGGYLAESYSWRWAFHILVPLGVVAAFALHLVLPRAERPKPVELDWIGFLALSIAVSALQLVLSRGVRLDWFESTEIIIESLIAAVAFYVFIAHSLTAPSPFLNLRLLLDRNYAVGLVLVTIYGMLNFTPMVLLPPLLQQHAGYPDSLVGEVIGYRGIGAMMGFFAAGILARLDPRLVMTVGFLLQVASGVWLMSADLNIDMVTLRWNSVLQGLAVGIIWVPLTAITFETLAPAARPEATAVFHLLRNIGSSFFISLCVAEIVRATGANYSRLTEMVTPYNTVLSMPWVKGEWVLDTVPGLAGFAREITRQAAMIGYVNAFMMYTVASAAGITLIVLVRRARG